MQTMLKERLYFKVMNGEWLLDNIPEFVNFSFHFRIIFGRILFCIHIFIARSATRITIKILMK